tara:strand:- start:168 stop:1811 length:1644 start_codon:yes stop_codon:yes gene_type:complete
MGEQELISLATSFLQTPKGKLLLGEEINISGITSQIQSLSQQYNIDLESLATSTLEEKSQALIESKKVDTTLSAKERIKAKSSQASNSVKDKIKSVKEELIKLKAKLISQIPRLETYTITGRIFDQQTGNVLKGVKVQLGVNTGLAPETDFSIPVNKNLISNLPSINFNDLVYIPIPTFNTQTDDKGEFSLEIRVPIIPQNQRTPLNLGVLYSKSKFLPTGAPILNGDKTIKTNLSASSLININKAAESISQEFNDKIDEAQSLVAAIGLTVFEKVISARKLSIAKIVDAIKSKLIPLAITLLLGFGISKLSQANRKTCPTPEELAEIIKRRNSMVRQLNQMYAVIIANTAIAFAFFSLSKALKGVRLSLDSLPIPQAIGGPGPIGLVFSQPYSFTAKLQDINDELEKLEEQFQGMNRSTLVSLVFLIAGTVTCILLLQGIDKMAQECAQENGATPLAFTAINQELLDLSKEQEEDGNPVISNLNGFIMAVVTDDQNPVGSLKRRYAIAKNSRGVVQLKGEPSFSASDQVLIDELVFYIQQNDLKAY